MGIEPIYAMAGGVMLGGLLQLAVQIPALHRLGLLPRIGLGWSRLRAAWDDPGTRQVARMMVPALLGVGVAHISILINTQIASWLAPGSVTWLGYADRLMEFPTAMLGVALGVVLMPQLAGAHGPATTPSAIPPCSTGACGWSCCWPCRARSRCWCSPSRWSPPCSTTAPSRTATCRRLRWRWPATARGWSGLVAIKVLAPGFYASQDMRTPVRIAIVVLVITQLLNIVLVPMLKHAGLALSIGIGALINAGWLLAGLLKRGSYRPAPGWGVFALQVLAATALLAVFLMWAAASFPWIAHAARKACSAPG